MAIKSKGTTEEDIEACKCPSNVDIDDKFTTSNFPFMSNDY